MTRGPRERLYDEQAQLANLSFKFKEKVEPINYVSSVASGMHTYSSDDILRGPYLMTDYDAKMLTGLLKAVVPANALITLDDAGVETDTVSEAYEVPYSRVKVSGEVVAGWEKQALPAAFNLPAANDFIAQDVSLKPIAKDNPALPEVVMEDGRQKIWFLQDDEFRIPKGASYINFRSPHVGVSADQTAAAVLYTSMLKDSVNEFAYPGVY